MADHENTCDMMLYPSVTAAFILPNETWTIMVVSKVVKNIIA